MNKLRLYKEMDKAGITTQEQLAKAIGTSKATVNNWFNGKHEPTYRMGVKIAKALNLDIEALSDIIEDKK